MVSEMTGLLSVFSLLPVQTVRKPEGSREEADEEEEEEEGGSRKSRGPASQLEDDIERYRMKLLFCLFVIFVSVDV